jgi:hypothetical protein
VHASSGLRVFVVTGVVASPRWLWDVVLGQGCFSVMSDLTVGCGGTIVPMMVVVVL